MRHIDRGSLIVIAVTFVLFIGALFAKGISHDLLLEAGVFLVSVKLIIMAYKQSVANDALFDRLDEVRNALARLSQDRKSQGSSESQATGDRPDV